MNDEIKHPFVKAASGLGVSFAGMSWSERAQMAAFIYTACLITEWMWKKVLKPLALRRGWIKGPRKDFLDSTGQGDLGP